MVSHKAKMPPTQALPQQEHLGGGASVGIWRFRVRNRLYISCRIFHFDGVLHICLSEDGAAAFRVARPIELFTVLILKIHGIDSENSRY